MADPDNALIYQGLADAYLTDKQYELARLNGLKAVDLDPSLATATAIIGLAMYPLNQIESGYSFAEKAYQLDPDNLDANNCMAVYKIYFGKYTEAVEYSNKTISIDPDNFPAHYYLRLCYELLGNRSVLFKISKERYRMRPSFETFYLCLNGFINIPVVYRLLGLSLVIGYFGGIWFKIRPLLIFPTFDLMMLFLASWYILTIFNNTKEALRCFIIGTSIILVFIGSEFLTQLIFR